MYFQNLVGNDHIKSYLTHMVQKGAIGNSLLFAGPDGIGKSQFALELAKMLICKEDVNGTHAHKIDSGTHPDIHAFRPAGKLGLHSIEAMRNFSDDVYLAPYEAKWKVFLIHDADKMLAYSANALLKTFEEPSPDSLIILLSSSPESLLPTVRSRCRTIYFHPVEEAEIAKVLVAKHQKSEDEAKALAAQADGSIGRALHLAERGEDPRRLILMNTLAARKMNSYNELQKMAAEIGNETDQVKKQVEESARQELLKGFTETLSATQQQALEKEIEGAVSRRYNEEVDALLGMILGWYRDLHLLHVNGNPNYLMHRDHHENLEDCLQNGGLLPLDEVQKFINQAKLALERSSSLNVCLESLFLKLNYL